MNGVVYYHKFSNGKGYIGITKNSVEFRLTQHLYSKYAFGDFISEFKIPSTLFVKKKLETISDAYNWAYVIKDSYNYDIDLIKEELKLIRNQFWHNRDDKLYKYNHDITKATFISPNGDIYYTYTKLDFENFCVDNNFSLSKAREVRAGKIMGSGSTLHNWKILRGHIDES